MKKQSLLYSLLFVVTVGFLASCSKDDEAPQPSTPDECAAATFPATTGTATVNFLNFPGSGIVEISAKAGDVLSIAVEINKGETRPKTLRVYSTDCVNAKGTIVSFKGQPQTNNSGEEVDLRNVDKQVRTVLYTVPSGMTPIYLNFEIDERGSDKITYKRLKINVTNSGVIDSFTGVTLGAQLNALPSRMSSSTGYVYLACETEANIDYIDVTYASTGADSYLASNPARFEAPIGLTAKSTNCNDEGTLPTDGGKATYFAASSANFDSATDETLNNLSVSSSDNQYIKISNGGVYAFVTSSGKKGLIKVTSLTTGTSGSVTVDVKVQR